MLDTGSDSPPTHLCVCVADHDLAAGKGLDGKVVGAAGVTAGAIGVL